MEANLRTAKIPEISPQTQYTTAIYKLFIIIIIAIDICKLCLFKWTKKQRAFCGRIVTAGPVLQKFCNCNDLSTTLWDINGDKRCSTCEVIRYRLLVNCQTSNFYSKCHSSRDANSPRNIQDVCFHWAKESWEPNYLNQDFSSENIKKSLLHCNKQFYLKLCFSRIS